MDNNFDKMYYDAGEIIAGVDESGVSDIAGPLIAACVVLPKIPDDIDDNVDDDIKDLLTIKESKIATSEERERLSRVIINNAVAIGIGRVTPEEMGYLKKHKAINVAMSRAIHNLRIRSGGIKVTPDKVLVDGAEKIKGFSYDKQEAIVKGDEKVLCIAAASIIAKVFRDEEMAKLHEKYPKYDFIRNKGAWCEKHMKGMDEDGIIPGVHRTFLWPIMPNYNNDKEHGKIPYRRTKWKEATEKKLRKTTPNQ